jgi:hypothetical protein
MIKLVALCSVTLLLGACAATDSNYKKSDSADTRNTEVRTGTRLPPRDTTSVKTVDGQDYKQDANRTIGTGTPGR